MGIFCNWREMFNNNATDSNYHLNKLADLVNNSIKPAVISNYIDVMNWKKSDNIEYILMGAIRG